LDAQIQIRQQGSAVGQGETDAEKFDGRLSVVHVNFSSFMGRNNNRFLL